MHDGRPGADVVPDEAALRHENAVQMLHHGEVDGNCAQAGIEPRDRVADVGRLRDRVDQRREVRGVTAVGVAHRGRLPDEHARVPEKAALRQVEPRGRLVRLLDEALHGVEDRLRAGIEPRAALDVAGPRLGTHRRDAHRHDRIRIRRHLHGGGQSLLEDVHGRDQLVGRQDAANGVGTALLKDQAARHRDRRRVPPAGFADDILSGEHRQHLARQVDEAVRRHDEDPLGRNQSFKPIHRMADQRLPAEQIQELLRPLRRRQRPEPFAVSAGHDDCVGGHK